jgi:hypothetical protein
MKEKNQGIFKKAIEDLPVFKVESQNLWENIERQLPLDSKKEKETLPNLPEFHAPDDLWLKIETELDKVKTKERRRILPMLVKLSAAAALLLLAGYFSFNWISNYQLRKNFFETSKADEYKEQGIDPIYNPALCKNNPQVCHTVQFKELDKQLNEIKSEIENMKPMIKGNDPQLLKYYYRLENEKAEIEKRMVKIIMNT